MYQHTFECCHGAVLSLVTRGDNVYAGCQDGYVKVWDLQARTLVRTIIVQEVRLSDSLVLFSANLMPGRGRVILVDAAFGRVYVLCEWADQGRGQSRATVSADVYESFR